MNIRQLKKIVAAGESDRAEFKASTGQRTSGAKTVCAMSDSLGGYLFFGVCNNGRILGPTTSIMTRTEYERGLFERMQASQRWKNKKIEQGITLKDLDRNTIRSTFNSARQLWNDQKGSLSLTFYPAHRLNKTVTPQVTPQFVALLRACRQTIGRVDLQKALSLTDREHFRPVN